MLSPESSSSPESMLSPESSSSPESILPLESMAELVTARVMRFVPAWLAG